MKSMQSPFQLVIEKLASLGVFSFLLPWILTAAVFWGLLKKSGMFGPFVNAVIALTTSFFIWGYFTTSYAIEIGTPLSTFIIQGSVIILVFLFGLIAASMFYPKFPEILAEKKSSNMIWVFLGIFVGGLFFTSGLYRILSAGPATGIQSDVITLTTILVALIIGILILVAVQRSEGGK